MCGLTSFHLLLCHPRDLISERKLPHSFCGNPLQSSSICPSMSMSDRSSPDCGRQTSLLLSHSRRLFLQGPQLILSPPRQGIDFTSCHTCRKTSIRRLHLQGANIWIGYAEVLGINITIRGDHHIELLTNPLGHQPLVIKTRTSNVVLNQNSLPDQRHVSSVSLQPAVSVLTLSEPLVTKATTSPGPFHSKSPGIQQSIAPKE